MTIMTCFFFQNALNAPTPPSYYNHQQQKLVDRILCSPYSIKLSNIEEPIPFFLDETLPIDIAQIK